jgi:mRNA-degrading endonuclease toxin of MazEF toxin-antitoxin module
VVGLPILRGNVYDLQELPGDVGDHVQRGPRPCVVIQNNDGNRYSNVVVLASLTRTDRKRHDCAPVPAGIVNENAGVVQCNMIFTLGREIIERSRFMAHLPADVMAGIDRALKYALDLT